MTPNEMAIAIVKALDEKKGQDIKALETTDLTSLADFFVICSATSTTQISALADYCEFTMKNLGEPPLHIEGHRGGTWVLLDFGCVVVHIFNEEAREFYGLEKLWGDAVPLDLSGVLTAG
ncbi:MAG: ribosome silencing factor [Oscillospiraceae bacterium]